MKKTLLICGTLLGFLFTNASRAQSEATFYTSMGDFTINLTDTLTPITVDSFIARVSEKFYDGLIFHRVIDNFMIQGGDPLGNGTGGPGYSFQDEFHSTLRNVPGALAMANSGPNTNGSQFYVNLVNNSHLNNRHTVFGMVTSGFDKVQAIGKVPTAASTNRPLTDVVMDSIRITRMASGIQNVKTGVMAKIYPNPSTGLSNIDIPGATADVTVTDITGKVVYQAALVKNGTFNINLGGKTPGLYYIRMENSTGQYTGKVLLQ